MITKKTATIVIPAFNESLSILSILKTLTIQDKSSFHLNQIVVVSDGSTDNTVALVKTNYPNIAVLNYKKNIGKSKRINQVLRTNKSDILVLVDADIVIKNPKTVSELIKPFIKNDYEGISCAYHLTNTPENFIEKMGYFGFQIWDKARNSLGIAGIRYYCEGGMVAYSKKFAAKFRLPENRHVGDDSYSFYYAITHGFDVRVNKQAKVYINSASTLRDYIRQMRRFLTDTPMVAGSFDPDIVKKYETITTKVKVIAFSEAFVRNPVIGLCYIALQIILKIQIQNYNQTIAWVPVKRKTN